MPSNSLLRWRNERADALDEIEHAHLRVGGSERGRRYATQQINHSYAVILSSQFQGFCRDLHSEAIDHIVLSLPANLRGFVRAELFWSRSLDRGNPHPAALGTDFNRLGVNFWGEVYALDSRNERRRELLEELNAWRNAIAHQDFDLVRGDSTLHLARVRAWRRTIGALGEMFDRVMYNHLSTLVGSEPWSPH